MSITTSLVSSLDNCDTPFGILPDSEVELAGSGESVSCNTTLETEIMPDVPEVKTCEYNTDYSDALTSFRKDMDNILPLLLNMQNNLPDENDT